MKLDIKQGWELVSTLMGSWMIRENVLADVEDILETYQSEIGERVFILALNWEGGMSMLEREKFSGLRELRDLHEELDESYHYSEEWDLSLVSDMILHITDHVKKFIDVDAPIRSANVWSKTVTKPITTHHIRCPYCEHENTVNLHSHYTKCSNCKIQINLIFTKECE